MPTISTWYVANAGSDSNSGLSSLSPFATIAKAISVLSAGDEVLLNMGDTFSENNTLITNGFVLSAYGSGAQPIVAGASTSETLYWANWSGAITITGITITNPTASTYSPLRMRVTDGATRNAGITIDGNTVTGGSACIAISTATLFTGYTDHILIEDNTLSGATTYGALITVGSTDHYVFSDVNVTGNTITGITGFNSPSVSGIAVELSGCDESAAPNFIQFNDVSNCGASASGSGDSGPGGLFMYYSKYVTIQWNTVSQIYASTDTHADGCAIDIDQGNTSCSLLNNYCHDCQGCGLFFLSSSGSGTHTIAGNVVVNCMTLSSDLDEASFEIAGTGTLQAYSNTIISLGTFPAVNIDSGDATNITLANNCFIAPTGVPSATLPASITGLRMNGNYHQSGAGAFLAMHGASPFTSLASWQSNTGLEAAGVGGGTANFVQLSPIPALTPSTLSGAYVFSPIAGSPLINAGANLLSLYGITPPADFLGNAWQQDTIGAIYDAWAITGPVPIGFEGGMGRTFEGGGAAVKIFAGTTDLSAPIYIQNLATGAGLAVAYNASGLVAEYRRAGSSSWTAISLAAGTLGTWSSGGWAVDGSLTGAYEVGIPNAALASGATWVVVRFYGAANMAPVQRYIELDAVNYQSATAFVASANLNLSQTVPTGTPSQTVGGGLNAAIAQAAGALAISGTTLTLSNTDSTTYRAFSLSPNASAPTSRA